MDFSRFGSPGFVESGMVFLISPGSHFSLRVLGQKAVMPFMAENNMVQHGKAEGLTGLSKRSGEQNSLGLGPMFSG